jgi:hypothetical protein
MESWFSSTGTIDRAKLIIIFSTDHTRWTLQELYRCIDLAKINRLDVFITHFVGREKEFNVEIINSKAKVLIPIGEGALSCLTGRHGETNWRGSIIESTLFQDKLVIPTLNPATILAGQPLNRNLIVFDLQRAARIERDGFKPLSTIFSIRPSFPKVINFLSNIEKNKRNILDWDIEVYNNEVSCISLCLTEKEVLVIPFVSEDGDYWNPEQELEIWLKIASILEDKERRLGGQNLIFDCGFLMDKYGINIVKERGKILDCMIGQKIIMPFFKKGLDFICSVHTDIPYYKDEGKKWFKVKGKWEQLWMYNAMDSLACKIARTSQSNYLAKQDNEQVYRQTCDLTGPLVLVQRNGVRVSLEALNRVIRENEGVAQDLHKRLNDKNGKCLNTNSPKELIEFFYKKLGYRSYLNLKTKKQTINKKAIERLKVKGCEEADTLERLHKIEEEVKVLKSKFYDDDLRLRCSYDATGDNGITSSTNINGTGLRLNSLSDKSFLMVDEGFKGYSLFLDKAEERIIAAISGIEFCQDIDKNISCGITSSELKIRDRISDSDAKVKITSYFNKFPSIKRNFQTQIKQDLTFQNFILNLMGRRIQFMGKQTEETVREALILLPKTTKIDIVNERIVNNLFYNKKYNELKILAIVNNVVFIQTKEGLDILRELKTEVDYPLTTTSGEQFIIPLNIKSFTFFGEEKTIKL